ncbi:MAG: MAPEG family protein [Xanthomonadales bacterium]|nr:MAPEG family protein [Xanthomonadales bacterium]
MTTPYLCILIAALLPYAWVTIAKASGDKYDNRDPRGWLAQQDNARSHRANAAQLNGFETFPAFAASVLMAQFAGVAHGTITWLAIGFVVFRVLHGLFYIGNRPQMRSLAWFLGLFCVLGLMGMAIAKVA